jgi:hypothetical protein
MSAELLVPDDVGLHWDRAYNGVGDDRVALVPVDVMVFESESGEPLVDVALDIQPVAGHVSLLHFDAVAPLDAADCAERPCLWDARRDRYFEVAAGSSDADAGGSEPDVVRHTDRDGLARFYVLVDSFPGDGVEFAPVPVLVSMGIDEATFQLVPQ